MSDQERRLYLEDLRVGQRFDSAPQPISAAEIKRFAGQFDPQPFHLDDEAARESFFQGLAASGWHTAALGMRLLVASVPLAGGIVGTSVEELRWLKPVRPDDILRLESEVVDIQPGNRSRGLVRIKSVTLNQRGDTIQMLRATLLVSKRPERR